jgi:hypothetical protein
MNRAMLSLLLLVSATLGISAAAQAAEPAKATCPKTAMCRRAQMPCEMAPPCDRNGRPVSMCWVKKPAGSSCTLNGRPGKCSKTGLCTTQYSGTATNSTSQGAGGAKPVVPTRPTPGQSKPANDIALCKAGTGGARCQPCPAGTYSSGAPVGKECGQCPPHAMCMRMPMPCEEMPTCDPKTGKVASMCWVKKPEGAACNPESGMIMPADTSDGMSYTCQAGECVPSP